MPTQYRFSESRCNFIAMILCGLFMSAATDLEVLADEPRPKPVAQAAPRDDAGPPTLLNLTVTLEDGAKTPLSLKLRGIHEETLKTWENVRPGELRLEAPKLEPGGHSLLVKAKDHIMRRIGVHVSKDGVEIKPDKVELARLRYAVLRYDVNVKGKQALTGEDVRHFRVAVTHLGSLPELRGAYMIRQDRGDDGRKVMFNFQNRGDKYGFAIAPAGKKYDELDAAPPPDEYTCQDVVCEKGMVLFTRVVGQRPETERYAKILIEDVTETPPKGAELIESGDFWKDRKYAAVNRHTPALSGEQRKAAEEDLRVATEKMDELMADAEKLPMQGGLDPLGSVLVLSPTHRGGKNLKAQATNQLSSIKARYGLMAKSNPSSAAKWYRSNVEGKTIYDFAGEEARPEIIAAVEAVQTEIIRLHKSMIPDELHVHQFDDGVHGLRAEAVKRFPKDRMARMNWFLDQVRGKKSEDLTTVLGLALGFSDEQVKTAEANRQLAQEKMQELRAAAETLPQGGPGNARINLIRIQSNYSKRSQADPVTAATWFRQQLEGKTVEDFKGPEQAPEFAVPQAAASRAETAAVEMVNKEMTRFYDAAMKGEDAAQRNRAIVQYHTAGDGLYAEARKRFPNDNVAQWNWFLDQIRGKSAEDLPAVLESARAAAAIAASPAARGASPTGAAALPTRGIARSPAEKSIDPAKALSAIKANEAKVRNAQWHVVCTTGVLARSRDISSYRPLPLTRTEANVLYDYQTDHYRVEISGVSEWPKSIASPPTPQLEWNHCVAYDGRGLQILQFDGPFTPQAFIVRDTAQFEGQNVVRAVITHTGGMYFLNGSPYGAQAVPWTRMSKQLETGKQRGRIKVNERNDGVWVIADLSVPLRLVYDPRKGSILGAEFVTALPPPEPANANPNEATKANENERSKTPIELTGILKIELQRVGEFWPPKTVTHANFLDADAAQRYEFSDVKINQPLSPAAVTVEFPPGAHVIDRVAKTAYTVAGPAVEPGSPDAASLSPGEIPFSEPATQSDAMPWIVLVLSSLAAALLIGVVVVMRRRARA